MNVKKMIGLLGMLLLSTSFFACGDDADDKSTAAALIDQPLEGTVNGKPFSVLHGHATFSEDRNEFSVTLQPVASESDCSGTFGYSDEQIIFFRPAEVGGGPMSLQENITFAYTIPGTTDDDPGISQNDIATIGYWEFTEITDDKVIGGLVAETDDHSVNGTFELTRCPDPFANF